MYRLHQKKKIYQTIAERFQWISWMAPIFRIALVWIVCISSILAPPYYLYSPLAPTHSFLRFYRSSNNDAGCFFLSLTLFCNMSHIVSMGLWRPLQSLHLLGTKSLLDRFGLVTRSIVLYKTLLHSKFLPKYLKRLKNIRNVFFNI